MKKHIFASHHPAVVFLYFLGCIGFTMCTLHPLYVAASFLISSGYCIFLKGVRSFLRSLGYYSIIFILVAVVNPLVNSLGLTVLFYLGSIPITAEALCYGMCSGGMLISVIQWFSCYQQVMSSDKFLSLFGRMLPAISMMVSMVFRYIPDTIRKGNEIRQAQAALAGNTKPGKKEKVKQGIAMASILMNWSMENSLETADSMRARGYGSGRRSLYTHEKFTLYDKILFFVLLLFVLISGYGIFSAAGSFTFYPRLSGMQPVLLWALPLYCILLAWPLLEEGKEKILWM